MTDMLHPDEITKLREIMGNFVQIKGDTHPEHRLERIERKIEHLTESMHKVEMGLSNAQLVQKGVLWLGGIIGSSAVVMAMTFLFKGV